VEPVNDNPTLQDIWRLLGVMNRRFDSLERQMIRLDDRVSQLESTFEVNLKAIEAKMQAGFGALKASIEARDFRLDEHARRLAELEKPQ
jgi:hypothetical protein